MTANSSVLNVLNQALVGIGLIAIPSVSAYTSGIMWLPTYSQASNTLDKYQQQGVIWLDILQRMMGLCMNKRFMWRRFQFQTPNNAANATLINQFTINNVIVEGFRANSFFNVTYGAGPGNPIQVIPYDTFMRMYARPDIIPIGTPLWLVPIPDDGSTNTTVQLVPTPDQTYNIEGQCRLLVPPIMAGSDQTIFPYRYEAILITKTIQILEGRMQEGQEQSVQAIAEEFIQTVLRDAGGADEEQEQLWLGFSLWNRWRGESARDYNPTTDVAPPYP